MFEYWRKHRALERELKEVDKEYLPKVERAKLEYKHAAPGEDFSSLIESDYKFRRKRVEIRLAILEANRLFKLANRYGVEGTPPQEIDDPNNTGDHSRRYFTPKNQEQFERMIADARRKRIKEWVEIVSPVASVIISLLAFLLAALALYLQVTR